MLFQTCRDAQKLITCHIVKGNHIHHSRLCFGQSTGLIKDDRVAVSYTHLDVYKRQTLEKDWTCLGISFMIIVIPLQGQEVVVVCTNQGKTIWKQY